MIIINLLLLIIGLVIAQSDQEVIPEEPCTAKNPFTGNFFDLRSLQGNSNFWSVRSADFPYNITMGICSAVMNNTNAGSAAGYYWDENDTLQSLGEPSQSLFFRAKHLMLEYKGGSACRGPDGLPTVFNKSTTLIFKCDRAVKKDAYISYVASPNDCTFLFNVFTPFACPQVDKKTSTSPYAVFLGIGAIACIVYFFGALFYRPMLRMNGISILRGKKSEKFLLKSRSSSKVWDV